MGVQVHGAGALARTQLIRVGERILQQLHHRVHAGGLILDLLDGRALLTQIGEVQGNAAATLGELEGRVDSARDGLHVVLDAQQEAGDEFAPGRLARVEEGGGSRLETPGDDFFH